MTVHLSGIKLTNHLLFQYDMSRKYHTAGMDIEKNSVANVNRIGHFHPGYSAPSVEPRTTWRCIGSIPVTLTRKLCVKVLNSAVIPTQGGPLVLVLVIR